MVQVWSEEQLPTASSVRALFGAELERSAGQGARCRSRGPPARRPMPLIPVAEMEELLAEGDLRIAGHVDGARASAFFDDLDMAPDSAAPRRLSAALRPAAPARIRARLKVCRSSSVSPTPMK